MDNMISIDMIDQLAQDSVLSLLKWSPKLLGAILVLAVGFWLVNKLLTLLDRVLENRKIEKSLSSFLESLLSVSLKMLVVVSALTVLGVKTTSLIAFLGAAGLAIGLALQGSLANFAGGMLILFFKPFKAGDYISASSKEGTVEKIMIFNTTLKTLTNEMIVIPNADLSNGVVQNYTANKVRRLDLKLGVAYDTDIDAMRSVVLDVIRRNEHALTINAPEVLISGHGDNAIEVLVRIWVKPEAYWELNFYMWEEIKKAFDKNGISIPFPQRDVNIVNGSV